MIDAWHQTLAMNASSLGELFITLYITPPGSPPTYPLRLRQCLEAPSPSMPCVTPSLFPPLPQHRPLSPSLAPPSLPVLFPPICNVLRAHSRPRHAPVLPTQHRQALSGTTTLNRVPKQTDPLDNQLIITFPPRVKCGYPRPVQGRNSPHHH